VAWNRFGTLLDGRGGDAAHPDLRFMDNRRSTAPLSYQRIN
jgi:hypothetical protein